MADGKKNDDNKIIKNPLLRQNFLLEEISGISFIVPAEPSKQESETNGSKRDNQIPPLGEKEQVIEARPQETSPFTDIPLETPDSKENPKDSQTLNISPSQASKSDESQTFGLRSIIPSFVPLLIPPSFKANTSQEPSTNDNVSKSEVLPRHSPLEILEPELIPPPKPDSAHTVPPFGGSALPSNKSDLNSGINPNLYSNQPKLSPLSSPPLSHPPPISSTVHSGISGNPYKLRSINHSHPSASTLNRGLSDSKRPSESLLLQSPQKVQEPDLVPFLPSAVGTPTWLPPLSGPSQAFNNPDLTSTTDSVLNSVPPEASGLSPSFTSHPPPISNIINTGISGNPYKLKSISHSQSSISAINVGLADSYTTNQNLAQQSPPQAKEPEIAPQLPSSDNTLNASVKLQSPSTTSSQVFNNPDLNTAPDSVLNSAHPEASGLSPPLTSHPPPLSTVINHGISGNPYKLRSTSHSQSSTSTINWGLADSTTANENLSHQSPLQAKEPEIVPYLPSSVNTLNANAQLQSPFTGPGLANNYADLNSTSNSVLNSALPKPSDLSPPPVLTTSDLAVSGNSYNPQSVNHSHSNASLINWGSTSQSTESSEAPIPFYSPISGTSPHSFNLFTGPLIAPASAPVLCQETIPKSNNRELLLQNITPEDKSHTHNSVLSSVQTLTSAISNLIAPSKEPENSASSINFSDIGFSGNSSVPNNNSYQTNTDATVSFNKSNHNDNTIHELGSITSSQPPLYQSPTYESTFSLNQATSAPTFNFFNTVSNANVTGSNTLISNHFNVADNTVCVSSITTVLTSATPAQSNCAVQKDPVEYQSINSDLPPLQNILKPELQPKSESHNNHEQVPPSISNNSYNHQSNNFPLLSNINTSDNKTVSETDNQFFSNNLVSNNNLFNKNSKQETPLAVHSIFTNTDNSSIERRVNNLSEVHSNANNPISISETKHEIVENPSEAEKSEGSINSTNVAREVDLAEPVVNLSNPLLERPVPVVQPIPTFNYFSSKASCFPPSLNAPPVTSSCTKPELPSSSFFKPIDSPNKATTLSNAQPLQNIEGNIPLFFNPIQSALPKVSFPPPNIPCPPKLAPPKPPNPQSETSLTQKSASSGELDLEELDQIPLEGSAVPLYNPDYISRKKKADIPDSNNTYRLNKSLKKPTYAPVPDLGVTEKKSCPDPVTASSQLVPSPVSSLEEMASIEAQSRRSLTQSPPKTPSGSSATLEPYYANLIHAPSYRPPYHHWFFKSGRDKKSPWTPFSMADSLNLEQVFTSTELDDETKVATDGGRYDVEILRRRKIPVYWEEPPGEVRRCSWFVKSLSDSRYTPYDENIAALLEDEYKIGCETNEWNRRIELADGEVIILHSPTAMAHHVRSSSPDAWGSQPTLQQKPRIVKRGVEDFDIPKGESKQVDHLLLVVHGVGKACDLRFRSLMEVVDDFRSISLQLVQSHFHSGVQNGNVGRVEILPVEWHGALHTETINDRLSAITLPSIPRAREFTNETLLDILFYTSPVFCEKIVNAVGAELNRVYTLYKTRNPGFRGEVSLSGHSLGSLILFDILCHQQPVKRHHLSTQASLAEEEDETVEELGFLSQRARAKLSRRMSYLTIGPGTGQPYTIYPQLLFQPKSFFALGSPIGMFVTVRGLETLGEDFKFPTCPAFFNIFHPNDPVAYRIEALIKPELATVPAVLIPHHKGRKRMHLELKETMAHVTAALKQKLVDSMKNTWNAVYQLALFSRKDNALPGEVSKAIEDEVLRDGYLDSDPPIGVVGEEGSGSDVKVGKLNGGRRVDYVLQEAPLETFNQYISAIRSHLVYWESNDTVLMMLKEIYGLMGIEPDTQVPQPILPFDVGGESEAYSEYTYSIGATPTQFVRK